MSAPPPHGPRRPGLLDSARRIAPLAWPVFVGQLAVLAFSTVDTLMVARYDAVDLAALAVGAAVYITVFIGLMGVVLALGPIVGQLFGARRLEQAGEQLHQGIWLALLLSVPGCALLLFPQPFLAFADPAPEVAAKVRAYLAALAFALPPALLFTAFRGFNISVSRPRIVMALQIGALVLKVPLSALLVFGLTLPGGLAVPALGAAGCGIATAIAMWGQWLLARAVTRRDPFYAPFGLARRGLSRPRAHDLGVLLRLGIPMGLSIGIEVTGFTFMAFFISRLGTIPVAGHQIASNLAALLFMMPLALGNAAGTLVAQSIGAGALADARRLSWHGVTIGVGLAVLVSAALYVGRDAVVGLYTQDAVIVAAALPLVAWVSLFHPVDALQAVSAFVLRAQRLVTVPLLIYAAAIWGIGIGGGYWLVFVSGHTLPPALAGPSAFWAASTLGLAVAGSGLALFLHWTLRTRLRAAHVGG